MNYNFHTNQYFLIVVKPAKAASQELNCTDRLKP
jgi:hypothetical protein